MLNEQAAINFLFMEKPLYRKYAFRMVLAAQNFGRLSMLDHSQRCLTNVMLLLASVFTIRRILSINGNPGQPSTIICSSAWPDFLSFLGSMLPFL